MKSLSSLSDASIIKLVNKLFRDKSNPDIPVELVQEVHKRKLLSEQERNLLDIIIS